MKKFIPFLCITVLCGVFTMPTNSAQVKAYSEITNPCSFDKDYDVAELNAGWACSVWSKCSNEKQTRECDKYKDCENTSGKPKTERVCKIISNSPEQLFDIFLIIENALLNKSSDLVARIQFVSFGTVPTLVNMVYQIEDASGREVYTEKDEVTVETEQLVTKDFKNLNIGSGKYTLVLTTTYGDNVQDKFRQVFEVKTVIQGNGTTMWILIVLGLVVVGIGGLVVYILRKRKMKIDTVI